MTTIVARETGEKREPLALPPLERESLSFTGKGDLMRSPRPVQAVGAIRWRHGERLQQGFGGAAGGCCGIACSWGLSLGRGGILLHNINILT
ncbi:hypothetical protein HC928_25285 [bacterium]|nr:hypothetical protein [bacterium]